MNYVLMGITCVVFVYIVYRMGKSHTKECNDDITYNYSGYIGGLGHQRQKYLDTLVRDIFRI